MLAGVFAGNIQAGAAVSSKQVQVPGALVPQRVTAKQLADARKRD